MTVQLIAKSVKVINVFHAPPTIVHRIMVCIVLRMVDVHHPQSRIRYRLGKVLPVYVLIPIPMVNPQHVPWKTPIVSPRRFYPRRHFAGKSAIVRAQDVQLVLVVSPHPPIQMQLVLVNQSVQPTMIAQHNDARGNRCRIQMGMLHSILLTLGFMGLIPLANSKSTIPASPATASSILIAHLSPTVTHPMSVVWGCVQLNVALIWIVVTRKFVPQKVV